jgi:hypothetical protein
MADDGDWLEVILGDVLVKLLDYGREDGAGWRWDRLARRRSPLAG